MRAASLAWFDKEPKRLTLAESALLVALPQLPEKRRPDRNPVAARAARDRVLARMVAAGKLDQREAARAAVDAVPAKRHPLPALAPHLAYAALRKAGDGPAPQLTIRKSVQQGLEAVARSAAKRLGPKLSVAMVLADSRTGDILGEVGSANYFDASRSGWIDMTRVLRSPGSTLKPFIYGLAFEQGLVAQQTLIEDSPADFSGYRPKNFDMAYQGFGSGIDADAFVIRELARQGVPAFVANSFSKNFSLYGERCGGLSVICESSEAADRVLGQLTSAVRSNYSNPPTHGARLVAQVLTTPTLRRAWEDELDGMRTRIATMRAQIHARLAPHVSGEKLSRYLAQRGMFTYTGLSAAQADALRETHGVYLLRSGRMCVAGLNTRNVDTVAQAIARVLTND